MMARSVVVLLGLFQRSEWPPQIRAHLGMDRLFGFFVGHQKPFYRSAISSESMPAACSSKQDMSCDACVADP
jgi:hypothetical protein